MKKKSDGMVTLGARVPRELDEDVEAEVEALRKQTEGEKVVLKRIVVRDLLREALQHRKKTRN